MKRRILYLATIVVIVCTFSLIFTATAQRQPESISQPQNQRRVPQRMEDFDIRAGLNRSLPALSDEPAQQLSGRQLVAARNSRLRRERPSAEMQFSNLSNAPSRVYSFTQNLTQSTADVEAGARFFLKQNNDLYQLRDDEVDGLKVARRYRTDHNGVTHLTLQQEVNGVEVFQGDYSFHFDRFGSLITAGGELIPSAARSANATRPRLTASAAFRRAAEFADVELSGEATTKAPAAGRALKQKLSLPAKFGRDIEARLVYFPALSNQLRLAWEFEMWLNETSDVYQIVVDADSGILLYRQNLTVYCFDSGTEPGAVATGSLYQTGQYSTRSLPLSVPYQTQNPHGLVFTKESPRPNLPVAGVNPPVVQREDLPFRAATFNGATIYPANDPRNDWWNGQSPTTFTSNNTDTYLDRNANDSPDDSPRLTVPDSNFSFPLDLTMAPTTPDNQKAALANTFYWVNRYHDILYLFGFNEAAGNYQTVNFSGQGLGNDPVRAEVQDGSGTNNANFSPSPDGSPGRMQMYLWTGNPQRDGDFDQGVIIHELTHGLSTRLVRPLSGFQQMGEGWSDYFGLVLLAQPSDNLDGSYAVGQFVTGNYTRGIRRFPYSTSTSVYPLMYADIATSVAPHGVGEIWCNTLLEARAQLIRKLGFTEGQRQSLQLAVDGMKMSPPSPSFLDSRNSIMLADRVNNGGANQCAMWTAFAKRGMGFSASTLDARDQTPVQAFDMPPFCSDLGIVQFNQTSYLLGESVGISLGDRNATGTIRAKVRSSVTGDEETVTMIADGRYVGAFSSSLRVVTGAATPGDGQLQASLAARDKIIVTYDDADNGSGAAVQVMAQSEVVGEKTFFDDSVETGNLGWSVTGTPAGTWAIAETPSASGSRSWTDSPNRNYASGTNASLVSPLMDLSAAVGVTITFAHRYALTNGSDYGNVEFSLDDGATWKRATAFTGTLTTFNQVVLKLDALAGQSRVRIRFRLATVSIGDGWTIDDIRVIARSSDPAVIPPPSTLAPMITGVIPASGVPAGNTAVMISGLNFTETGDVKVFFNGVAGVNVRALGSTSIAVNTPAQPAGKAAVRIETRYGTVTLSNAFTYYTNGTTTGAPDVMGVSPNTGSTKGGTIVTINGANFSPETTVLFGTTNAVRTFINSNTLRATAPAATATGAVNVTVRNSATAEKIVTGAFTYTAQTPPTVSVIAPTGGEKVFTGSIIPLRWQSADNRRVVRHRLDLYRSTATTPQLIANIADLGGESLSFNWTIPAIAATTNGRLRVLAIDDEGAETEAFSTSDFVIEARWQTQPLIPNAVERTWAASDGKYIYLLGGRRTADSTTSVNTLQRLDPAASSPTWEPLANMPVAMNGAKSVVINGKLYLPGGFNVTSDFERNLHVYDIAANSWTTLAAPPKGLLLYGLTANNASGVFYVTGGTESSSGPASAAVADVSVYNISTNTWSTLPSMATPRAGHESVLANGKLYVVGGASGTGAIASGEVFDFTTQKWSPIAPMPLPRQYAGSALATNTEGRLVWLIFGGESGTAYPSAINAYDFAANSWITLDGSFNLSTGRSRLGSASLGGFVYAVAGTTGNSIRTVERLKLDGFTILPPNQPPLVSVPVTQQIALPGRELSFVVSAQDLGSGVPVSLTASGMPNGATFNATNDTNNSARGTFRWTPAAADIGRNITVSFTATDGMLSDVKIVQITVVQAAPVTAVNAADFRNAPLAADSIAAAFGSNLAPRIEIAQSFPLPTSLAETMLTINGIAAPLFFVSPTQINFVVPAGVEPGSATIIVSNGLGNYSLGNIQIVAAAPAIFTANASGTGDAAAQTTIDGVNFLQPPFDVLVNGRPNILVLYGTGFRRAPATNPNDGNGVAESVTATIDGRVANVQYAGAQGGFAGLDQLNIEFPASLAGTGPRRVEIVINVNGIAANRVTVQIK